MGSGMPYVVFSEPYTLHHRILMHALVDDEMQGMKKPEMPDDAPAVARLIFSACTALDPRARPSAAQVVGWLRDAEATTRP